MTYTLPFHMQSSTPYPQWILTEHDRQTKWRPVQIVTTAGFTVNVDTTRRSSRISVLVFSHALVDSCPEHYIT